MIRFGAPPDLTVPEERSNFQHFVLDVGWFGLAFAATSRFLSVYAIRLGAGPTELGLISALPALILLFSAPLGGWWIRRYRGSVRALFWPGLGYRMLFLLPALAPFFPIEWQPAWLVASVTLPAIPQGISAVVFIVIMRAAIRDNHLTALLSYRQLAFNLALCITALAFGLWLEAAPFPFNYQAMFIIAFIFALVSQRHCNRVITLAPVAIADPPTRENNPWRSTAFLRVIAVTIIIHIAFMSLVPVTPLRLVEDLNASEGFMALFGLAELIAGATIAMFTSRLVARLGNRKLIALAMVGTAFAALIISLAQSLPLTLIGAAFSGASWTAASIGLFGFFTERAPSQGSARFTTAFHQAIGLATFIGPLIGSMLAGAGMNLVTVIVIGAGLRLAAGVLTEIEVVRSAGRSSRARLRVALHTRRP